MSTIIYDANCNLCIASVKFLTKHDTKHRLSFVPLNSTESRAALKNVGVNFVQKNTVYFIHQQKAYVKSTAVLKALSLLRFPVNVLSVFIVVPRFIRDYFYGIVAKNRTKF
jgi:predicted DCC family thiol-disulfide oxidoreductase YuxK